MKKVIRTTLCLFSIILVGIFSIYYAQTLKNKEIRVDDTNFQHTTTAEKIDSPLIRMQGMVIGLHNEDGSYRKSESGVFKIQKGESFSKFLFLSNNTGEDTTIKILAFINFKQQKFSVDGKTEKSDFTFKLKDNEAIEIPITLEHFGDGRNEVILVAVREPTCDRTDMDFRIISDTTILTRRFDVINGEDKIPSYQAMDYPLITKKEILNSIDGIFISEDKYENMTWMSQSVPTDAKIDYFIRIVNREFDYRKTYAVITMLNWEQVEIDGENDVIFSQVNSNEGIEINASIKTPKEEGQYELCTLLIYNPYEKLTIYNDTVESSCRALLNVTDTHKAQR